jgi:hypothetical protein
MARVGNSYPYNLLENVLQGEIMIEHKTVKVVTDEILNQMVNGGWTIVHLQFDGEVLRGVFSREVKAPARVGVPMVVKPIETAGAVAEVVNQPLGTDASLYRRRTYRPVPVGKLKVIETPEQTIARLDAEVVSRVTNWVAQNVTPPTYQQLLCEVKA